jgi:glycerol-3-phosphate dehydrogenase (NAD(P)+)
VKLGGRAETLAGLCGLGDLVLTCSSSQSRNMSFGLEIGRGRKASEILAGRRDVTEGAESAPAVVELGRRLGVDLPICETVLGLVQEKLDARTALGNLLARPFGKEN